MRAALGTHLTLLVIPLALMTGNALVIRNCSFTDGLLFFLLLPAVSVWFSVSVASFCALHYRRPRAVFIVWVLCSFGYAAVLGYVTPAVYAYNVFFGFFPGFTYDEGLRPDSTLVLFRLFTAGLGTLFFWLALVLASSTRAGDSTVTKGMKLLSALRTPRRAAAAIVASAALALVFAYRGELGFESPAAYVQVALGAMYETPHFMIYYSPQSFSPAEIKRAGDEHEFRLRQVMTAFHLPSQGTIRSYVYPSTAIKRRLMGAGGTNIAKPWSGEIHLTTQSMDATLKHELVHVVAAPFGVPVIRAARLPGLVEGLAMAVEWDWGNRTLHEYAAGMRRNGLPTDVRGLMSYAGFASRGSSSGYVLAGSFCRYLIDTYGIGPMTRVYRSADFPAAYGRSVDDLEAGWLKLLDTISVPPTDADAIDALFRRPPIFQKVCARVAGARLAGAQALLERRRFAEAAALYGEVFGETRSAEALGGYVASALFAGDLSGIRAVEDTVIRRDTRPGQYTPLLGYVGIAAWAEGDTSRALELFTRLARADISDDRTEAALVYSHALQEPVNRAALLRYFRSGAVDSAKLLALDGMVQDSTAHWLPVYLKGRVLFRMNRPEEAVRELEHVRVGTIDRTLEAFRLRTIGTGLFLCGRVEEARAAFWTSMNFRASEAWRISILDWIDRCDWAVRREREGDR
jgi:tetratricopeptide (TPR) repeat protein